MDNNKQRNPKVNKCARCKQPSIFFIWTTSARVNAGIKAMYPNEKICKHCYDDMRATYPDVKPTYPKCPKCSGTLKVDFINKLIADDEPYKDHIYRPKSLAQENNIPSRSTIKYCKECGYIVKGDCCD